MSLSRKKTSRTLYISQRYKKTVQRRFSTGQLGKGNGEKMCIQPAPEGAECLWRCDAGVSLYITINMQACEKFPSGTTVFTPFVTSVPGLQLYQFPNLASAHDQLWISHSSLHCQSCYFICVFVCSFSCVTNYIRPIVSKKQFVH